MRFIAFDSAVHALRGTDAADIFVPGTTRDIVQVRLELGGLPVLVLRPAYGPRFLLRKPGPETGYGPARWMIRQGSEWQRQMRLRRRGCGGDGPLYAHCEIKGEKPPRQHSLYQGGAVFVLIPRCSAKSIDFYAQFVPGVRSLGSDSGACFWASVMRCSVLT